MVSRFRMKVDLLGQAVLIVAVILLVFFACGVAWTNTMLAVLGIWQIASAIHLVQLYRHIKRMNFLKTTVVLIVSLPVWIHLVGALAYFPVAGVFIWYFIQTISDTIKVYNRPRSFWDL